MRQILVLLPSKLLALAAVLVAAVVLVRDVVRGRRNADATWSTTPLLALVAAWIVLWTHGGAPWPSLDVLVRAWPPLPLQSYGTMLALAFVAGWFLTHKLAAREAMRPADVTGMYLWAAVSSLVGARILFVLVQWRHFDSWGDALRLDRGGLVAYGGMIGGTLASLWQCRRRLVPFLAFADAAAPAVLLGTAITRVGCLLQGCDFGAPADVPWALSFPRGSAAWIQHVEQRGLPFEAARSLPVHPTQLYEAFASLVLLAALMGLRRVRRFPGLVFLGWVVGYGLARSLVEVLRDDGQRGGIGPFSTSQLIGLTSCFLGLGLLGALWRRHRDNRRAAAPGPHPDSPSGARSRADGSLV